MSVESNNLSAKQFGSLTAQQQEALEKAKNNGVQDIIIFGDNNVINTGVQINDNSINASAGQPSIMSNGGCGASPLANNATRDMSDPTAMNESEAPNEQGSFLGSLARGIGNLFSAIGLKPVGAFFNSVGNGCDSIKEKMNPEYNATSSGTYSANAGVVPSGAELSTDAALAETPEVEETEAPTETKSTSGVDKIEQLSSKEISAMIKEGGELDINTIAAEIGLDPSSLDAEEKAMLEEKKKLAEELKNESKSDESAVVEDTEISDKEDSVLV